MKMKKYLFLAFFAVIALFFSSGKIHAQETITEQRSFNYGTMVVTRNDVVYSMRIRRNGTINPVDPEVIPLGGHQSAEFLFTGFPNNTNLNISFATTSVTGPGAQFFTINNFTTANNIRTNGSGETTETFGSTLNTSGTGGGYSDGTYTGTITITVTF